ncbi:ABC transporter permease subunit [Saccharomonospora saliphila]|uniref:ABC transporter permease subunit n=1 Tax=Saccharomonospora saliphila TaxID=369829 RepID=UPI00037711F4|nr:ABC transporter permease subunit [Saccharomonospora saliphila]
MANLIKAEFRKTLSLKLWWALMIPAFALSFVFALGWGNAANDFNDFLGSYEARELARALGVEVNTLPVGLLALARGINVGTLFPVIFGISALAGEYTRRTITTTYLTAPHRGAALTAKLVTYTVWGAAYGVVLVTASSIAMALSVDSERLPSAGQWFAVLGAALLAAMLATLFGIGVGAVWNSVTGPTVTLVIWMLIIENLLVLLVFGTLDAYWVGGVLPNNTLNGIVGGIAAEALGAAGLSVPDALDEDLQWLLQFFAGAPGSYAWWSAALVFGAWTAAFFGAGWAANAKRDIT